MMFALTGCGKSPDTDELVGGWVKGENVTDEEETTERQNEELVPEEETSQAEGSGKETEADKEDTARENAYLSRDSAFFGKMEVKESAFSAGTWTEFPLYPLDVTPDTIGDFIRSGGEAPIHRVVNDGDQENRYEEFQYASDSKVYRSPIGMKDNFYAYVNAPDIRSYTSEIYSLDGELLITTPGVAYSPGSYPESCFVVVWIEYTDDTTECYGMWSYQ